MYYLQSRYYNPQWGRFLNADYAEVVSNNGTITDKNLFAYCDNNPVMYIDYWGTCPNCNCSACLAGAVDECRVCTSCNPNISMQERYKRQMQERYEREKAQQIARRNDANYVLSANGIVRYKDAWVVKVPFMKNNAFSYGVIFMGPDVNSADDLNHEYGHFLHMRQIGIFRYTTRVAVPSMCGYWTNVPYDDYYNQPWEYTADVLGGVNRGSYYHSIEDAIRCIVYYLSTLLM